MARLLALLFVLCVFGPASDVHAAAPKAHLASVRLLSSANYTRVMLDLTGRVKFTIQSLSASPEKGIPPRVYLDLFGARLAARRPRVDVKERLVQRVRMSQYKTDVVRVVLDLKQPGNYDAELLADPHRIVVDVERKGGLPVRTEAAVRRSVRRIVLDPGHGGKDPGAVGVNGVKEKDVALGIARMLARRLRREMGVDVVLTRDRDVFVSLKERTNIASREAADLFVSIHSNASTNRAASGLETYYLDHRVTDRAILKLAARENRTSLRNVKDRDYILSDMKLTRFACFTPLLAGNLQSSVVRNVRPGYSQVRDLGVKKGPFYVLTVGEMPAALVELFFLSNRRDARALRRQAVKAAVVEGLVHGVKEYADGLRTTRCR